MRLVSIHKPIFILLLILGWSSVQAQEVWTLKQCIETADVYNKTLQVNRNNIAIGMQREKEAKANLIPKISANADYKYFWDLPHQLMPLSTFNPAAPEGQFKEAQFGVPHNINANIQLMVPLYNPQMYGAIQNTKIASELTQLQYQKAKEQVIYDITSLYYNAQILQNQLAFIDTNLLNTHKLLGNMQLLYEQLMVKGTDVNKVKLQSEQLATLRDNVNNKYLQVLNALKLNMGIELNKELTVKNEINFQSAVEYHSKGNLDLQLIQAHRKLLNSEFTILKNSQTLPSLNLVASYGTAGFGYDKKPDNFLKFYPVGFAGIQFTYPIFNGTVTQRKIDQKLLEIKNNDLQSTLISEKNTMEIQNASRQRSVAYEAIINTESQIELAQTIYEQTILQQKQGTANLTDVLLADNAYREAQQNYLSAIIDYLKAELDIQILTGNIDN